MGLGFLNPKSQLRQAICLSFCMQFVCSKETERIDNKISESGGVVTLV